MRTSDLGGDSESVTVTTNEQAALKVLYLVATTQRKNREKMTGRINGWKSILNALTVHYGDRITNINR